MQPIKINKIALVRSGSRVTEQQAKQAIEYLSKRFDLEVITTERLWQYQSANQRAMELLKYLLSPDIDLVWSIRGGEGSADLLPFLQQYKHKIQQAKPKFIMGFSDFTPILVYCQQLESDLRAIHGVNALQLLQEKLSDKTIIGLKEWLKNRSCQTLKLTALNDLTKNCQQIKASCIGGNLTLLNLSIADIWQPETKNKFIIIEDWHEKAYQIDRTLKYLNRVGCFNQAKAIIFGDFAYDQAQDEQHRITMTLEKFANEVNLPIFKTTEFGHGIHNFLIPFYCEATIESGDESHLSFRDY